MSYSKAQIYNLALGVLLLSRRIIDVDTDTTNECKILNLHYDIALAATLADLDLDSTSTQVAASLLEEQPTDLWLYSYSYPSDCALLRRIQNSVTVDNSYTHIPKRVSILDGVKVILTNQVDAILEYVSTDVPISSLSPMAGMAVAYRLAILSAPLVTGKGAKALIESIQKNYALVKAEAQEHDRNENFEFVDPIVTSDFVRERTT
jgi:hypothetical protein